ncbi:MAG: rhomboid family intramembrane serine protease [Candidatus Poseidoniales archaeon]
MSEPVLSFGAFALITIGLSVTYYCIRNQFMVSQSLVFINFAIFASWWILYLVSPNYGVQAFVDLGFRSEYLDSPQIRLFTIFTAMFMHAGSMHILMNMLVLILLGVPFEERIGSKSFLKIYLISGLLGSLVTGSISVWEQSGLSTLNIGASGAVFGIMGGFALLYPRDEIPMLLGPIFMHRVPVLLATIVFVAMETLYVGMNTQDGIGHGTHMASFVAGVLLAPRLLSQEIQTSNEVNFDYKALEKLSSITGKGTYEIEMIKKSDEKELVDAWVSKFWELQECPDCNNSLTTEAECLDCGKDYLA